MKRNAASLADHVLLQKLLATVVRDRALTAEMLDELGEVDARRLYAPQGYCSMFEFCSGKLGFSEDVAYKRIRTARAARQFPAILDAIADGRLNLTAVVLLAPHLTPANAEELIAAASRRRKAEIEQVLAERFPQPDLGTLVQVLSPANSIRQLAPGPVAGASAGHVATNAGESDLLPGPPSPVDSGPPPIPEAPRCSASNARVIPLSAERVAFQFTGTRQMADDLKRALELSGLSNSPGAVEELFAAALKSHIAKLEKQRFAATSRSRPRRSKAVGRYVPAQLKRAVWQRDGGRCAFTSDRGHRCESRTRLEFDHVVPIARGGRTTLDNLRLLCRTHNQLAAERVLGRGFMDGRRQDVRQQAGGNGGTAGRPPA